MIKKIKCICYGSDTPRAFNLLKMLALYPLICKMGLPSLTRKCQIVTNATF